MPAETNIANGLYSIAIDMRDGKRSRVTGVLVLCDGRIMGGARTLLHWQLHIPKRQKAWRSRLIVHTFWAAMSG
jgi:hypothetical protein